MPGPLKHPIDHGDRESSRRWYHRNKDKVKIYRSQPHVLERKRIGALARRAAFTPEEREAYRLRGQRNTKKVPWRPLLSGAKKRAAQRGLPFDLTLDWAQVNFTGRCAITGIPFLILRQGAKGAHALSPSIDRIDGAKGYVTTNCRFVIHAVNSFKGLLDDDEMVEIARAIVASMGEATPRVDLADRYCNVGPAGPVSIDDLVARAKETAQRLLDQRTPPP